MSWVKRIGKWFFIALFALVFVTMTGQVWLMHGPLLLVFGWIPFLMRVVPQVTVRWDAIAETVAVVAVLGVGLHVFLGRGWRQLRPEEPRPWAVRWTASLLGLLVLLFSATMATVGVGHQVGWLRSTKEQLLYSTWRRQNDQVNGGGRDLCMQARALLERDPSGASVSRALLEDKELRRAAEALHTVLTRAPDGSEVFLIFPRDRHQLENEGVLRCAVQGPKEVFPSAALPKLLAGEAVADGIAL